MGNKSSSIVSQIVEIILAAAVGIACGYALAAQLSRGSYSGHSYVLILVLSLLAFVLALLLQILNHELGHLIFGLISGYEFCSLRLGKLIFIRNADGKLTAKKTILAGAVSQCLMSPPDIEEDGYLPTGLYNMGGVIFNAFTAIVFLWAYFVSNGTKFFPYFYLSMTIVGIGLALINGIPLCVNGAPNDGCNTHCLDDDDSAVRSYWSQLKVNQRLSHGQALKDMPEELFQLPNAKELDNPLNASAAFLSASHLLDEQRFSEAAELQDMLLSPSVAMPAVQRSLLVCDRIYCELLGNNDAELIEKLLTSGQQKLMKRMENYPTVIRTQYALARLHQFDEHTAEELKRQFEACADSYPYSGELRSQLELMELADKISNT
jgi:hypothetical protein